VVEPSLLPCSDYDTSEGFGASEHLPACDGVSPFTTFPSAFSTTFLFLPALVILSILAPETRCALHECYLAFMRAIDPLMYALVAVYKTSRRGGRCHDRGGADGA
jgi:hypothetical protein